MLGKIFIYPDFNMGLVNSFELVFYQELIESFGNFFLI